MRDQKGVVAAFYPRPWSSVIRRPKVFAIRISKRLCMTHYETFLTRTEHKTRPLGIMPMRFKPSWRYWKTPVLFGTGLCILQTLVAIVRFGGRESWNPIILLEIPFILLGLIMFFLCGLLIGLLVQRLLKGSSGAWRSTLMVAVALATPLAVWFSLVGGCCSARLAYCSER